MDNVLTFKPGRVPLLISMPHAGIRLTPAVEAGLADDARCLPDTDWHIPRLYAFATELGASMLSANYSRFVIDLNRPEDDTPLYPGATTGLYPDTLFDGKSLFLDGKAPSTQERALYLDTIWRPYHQTLAAELKRLRNKFGYALLFDAHSIRSHIPRLFNGTLPDLNLGTFNGESCASALADRLRSVCARAEGYTHVLNGRFKGGYITRHYGDPAANIHAVQLELAQSTYMEEIEPFGYQENVAHRTQTVLKALIAEMLAWGNDHYP
jgi:formiminoglutamase